MCTSYGLQIFYQKDMKKFDLSHLEHITTAGEALNPEVFEQVHKQTGLQIMEDSDRPNLY